MDIQAYIQSGILEEYCLGLLSPQEEVVLLTTCAEHPELQLALGDMQKALMGYTSAHASVPPAGLEEHIWQAINNKTKEQNISLNHLPLIDRYSDHTKWIEAMAPLLPGDDNTEPIFHELRNDNGVQQYLVVADADVPGEVHVDECERLLILSGMCECNIGENVVRLGPGGFLEIPLHVLHSIKLMTPRVTAILQRVAV